MRYKLAYRIVKTKEELKQIYPYIIEDLKTMEFKTNIGFPLGYEYRNGDEALSVFRKIYKLGKIESFENLVRDFIA